jgi:uncharacterized repeat protein (TIGR02543 family)
MMKKLLFTTLGALAVFALAMTGCPNGDDGDGEGGKNGSTKPVLGVLSGGTYSTSATAAEAQLAIAVSNAAAIGNANLKFQWWKSSVSEADAGAVFGAEVSGYSTGRYCAPTLDIVGDAWYWVVVTNATTNESTASNKAKVTVFLAAAGTAVERIVSQNASVPLWEFTIDDGADWADYDTYTVEYYVKKTSNVYTAASIRTRLYGAYILGDLVVPDQDDANGWGKNGGAGAFRMVNFNGSNITRPGVASVNPNNNFIIDNTGGTAASFGSIFSAAGGAPSKWFKAAYTTDQGIAEDFAKVTKLDKATVTTIFVGSAIYGPGGSGDDFEYFVRNPTLVHKTDASKNIVGKPNAQGTDEKLFAGNGGSERKTTDRSVLADGDNSYLDIAGEITIKFNPAPGSLATAIADVIILEGASLGDKFPAVEPTRNNYIFTGWFTPDGTAKVTATTVFDADTTLTARWEWDTAAGAKTPYSVPSANIPEMNTEAWSTDYNNGFVVDLGTDFDGSVYDTVTIVANYYNASGELAEDVIPAGNIQVKFHAGTPVNANSPNLATKYNLGSNSDWTSEVVAEGIKSTTAIPPAANSNTLTYLGFQSGGSHDIQFIEIVSITFDFND